MRKVIILLAVICVSLGQAQMSYYLSNKFWRLKQANINGREYQLVGNSNAPTLQFSGGSIRGNGGCNAYHTKFTINGDVLVIEKIMSTRMACNALELEEFEYFNAMAQSHTLTYEDGSNEFRLINANNDVLIFYSQFERTQSSYTPPVERQERETYYSNYERSKPSLSSKEVRRKRDLERKMKRGKLSKAERRELIKLQSKEKKTKIRKSKRSKYNKSSRRKKYATKSKNRSAKKKSKNRRR